MKKEEVLKMHEEYWPKVAEVLPNELSLPYLEIETVRNAYNNFHESQTGEKKDVGVVHAEIPSVMRCISPGSFVDLNFDFGGILIPTKCLEDEVNQTKVAVVHEQVHEVLRAHVMLYAINGLFDQSYPDVAQVIELFTESMAHGLSVKVLEEEMSAKEYFSVPVKVYNPRMREFTNQKAEMDLDEELELTVKQNHEFWKEIEQYHPIEQWHMCLEKFMELYVSTKKERNNVRGGVAYLTKLRFLAKRRVHNGRWEKIDPMVVPR